MEGMLLLFLILLGNNNMRFYRSAGENNSRRGSMSHMAIESFLFTFAGGGALGFAAGFSIKRIIKIALIILGAFVLAITYLLYKGIIQMNWDRAQHLTISSVRRIRTSHQQHNDTTICASVSMATTGTAYHFWYCAIIVSLNINTKHSTESDLVLF
jgi:uncharacterized membrane protein (Fun14 family)